MDRKLYDCQMPDCDSKVAIRSTIKTGEHKGKKVCQSCKTKADGGGLNRSPLKPFNPKSKEKRREERSELPGFFESSIEELKKSPTCQNCGCRINVNYEPVRNIAHILPKQKYKSVMAHPSNKIFLCSSKDNKDGKDCHFKFDTDIMNIPKMNCFSVAKEKFEEFKDEVTERGRIFHIFDEN